MAVTIRGTVKSILIDRTSIYIQIIPKDIVNGKTVTYGHHINHIRGYNLTEESKIMVLNNSINIDLLYQLKLNKNLVHFYITKQYNNILQIDEFSLIGMEISDE